VCVCVCVLAGPACQPSRRSSTAAVRGQYRAALSQLGLLGEPYCTAGKPRPSLHAPVVQLTWITVVTRRQWSTISRFSAAIIFFSGPKLFGVTQPKFSKLCYKTWTCPSQTFVTCERSSVSLKRVSETSHLDTFPAMMLIPVIVTQSLISPFTVLIYLINKVLHIFASSLINYSKPRCSWSATAA